MFSTYDEASKYSVGDQRPEALGWGQWRPGGYEQRGNQWVRPQSAPAMGPNQSAIATSLGGGTPERTTGQGFDERGYVPNPDTTKDASGGAAVAGKGNTDRVRGLVDEVWGKYKRDPTGDADGMGDAYQRWQQYADRWAKDGPLDEDYMRMRMDYDARDDESYGVDGTKPMTPGGNANQSMAMQAQNSLDPLLSGDPIARIMAALGKVNGSGQVNLDALLSQLTGG